MTCSWKLGFVALDRTDVLEERISSIIMVTRIGKLGTNLAATSNRNTLLFHILPQLLVTTNVAPSSPILVTLMIDAMSFSETSILSVKRRNIPEEGILHSHCPENLKSYIALTGWTL
jgi:hypothetical protein